MRMSGRHGQVMVEYLVIAAVIVAAVIAVVTLDGGLRSRAEAIMRNALSNIQTGG